MPVTTQWDDAERTIIRKDIITPWTWEEYRVSHDQTRDLMAAVDHPVALILNLDNVRLPADLVRNAQEILQDGMPDNWLMTVLASNADYRTNALFRAGLLLLPRFAPHVEITTTLEEARQIIAARYPQQTRTIRDNEDGTDPHARDDTMG